MRARVGVGIPEPTGNIPSFRAGRERSGVSDARAIVGVGVALRNARRDRRAGRKVAQESASERPLSISPETSAFQEGLQGKWMSHRRDERDWHIRKVSSIMHGKSAWIVAFTFLFTLDVARNVPMEKGNLYKEKRAYGILLDAGSGSTKGHVYTWDICYEFMPDVRLLYSMKKQRPDLASYAPIHGGDPSLVGENLKPILDKAREIIPEHMWKYSPVFLTATAGMRLLPESDRAIVLRKVNLWLADPDNHPFLYGTKGKGGQFWAQTISGDVEGVYGFIDLNFLMGNLHGQKAPQMQDPWRGMGSLGVPYKDDHEVAGWIDMGGASLQVSFAPQESTIISNVYPIYPLQYEHVTTSTGSTYASTYIYTHSWNGFGQRAARIRMQNSIFRKASGGSTNVFSDPCLLRGDAQVVDIDGTNVTFIGSSDYYACQWFVDDFVLDMKNECLLPPCGAAGIHVPPVDKSHFYGFTKMLEIARPLGYAEEEGSWSPTYDELAEVLARVCNMTSAEAGTLGIKNDFEAQSGPCFRGVFMMRFLQIMGSPQITFADRVEGVTLDYSRGAMLMLITYESLYPKLTPKGWPSCDPTVDTYRPTVATSDPFIRSRSESSVRF